MSPHMVSAGVGWQLCHGLGYQLPYLVGVKLNPGANFKFESSSCFEYLA